METKDKYYARVLAQVVCRHGMWAGDFIEELKKIPIEEQLDYAVLKNGKVIRVQATDENARLNVIGVFPSKLDGRYLELRETDLVIMTKKAQDEVPSSNDFELFLSILEPLNKAITKAGGIPLEGKYHTVVVYGKVRNYYPYRIVDIAPEKMSYDFSSEKKELKAKIRKFVTP